jgi:hypothetical protein
MAVPDCWHGQWQTVFVPFMVDFYMYLHAAVQCLGRSLEEPATGSVASAGRG